jgi:hypothetical protein
MANAKPDVLHGLLSLIVFRTLDTLGPQHGWGIAPETGRPAETRWFRHRTLRNWGRTAEIIARFLRPTGESS